MCEPTSILIASTALAVGGEVLQASAQNKQAKQNAKAATDSMRIQETDLGKREQEERMSAAQQIDEGQREAAQQSATAQVSASEAGVTGMSVDYLLDDIKRQEAAHTQSVHTNETISIDQLQRMKTGVASDAANRIAGAQPSNPFATGLKIGGTVLDSYSKYVSRQPKVKDGY